MQSLTPRPRTRWSSLKLTVVAVLAVFAALTPAVAAPGDDADFDVLLARYVKPAPDGVNRVDYAAWSRSTADRAALDQYITGRGQAKPSTLAKPQALAFWANTYNAITLKVILDRYPVASIRDIKSDGVWLDPKAFTGPWVAKRITVEGRELSLDQIEHEILRPTFKDPRVHYAVNCASFGCPNLPVKTWQAASLEADLDTAARAFVNHPRAASVKGGDLKVSSIYVWFKSDFGGDDAGVIAHLKKYAAPQLAAQLASVTAIAGDDYNWTLNGAVGAAP